ncbi:hypothetical protein EON65_40860 [archaeon]|nr:MAG: hypothetical protein EON65_40860 [archaeon]
MMFGILFGYMIIIRSGRLNLKNNTDSSLAEQVNKVFERIWVLHNKRNWIQEITIETLLSLMVIYPHPTFLSTCLDKIKTYLSVDLEQQSANHLLLKLGLGFISKQQKVIEQQVVIKLNTQVSFDIPTDLETYAPALVNACKKFPQVHKVWDYLLGFVFPLTTERELPSTR